jgi:NADPH-dependent glutamate synthase beta subunit-like oxidoreductase
MQPKVGGMMRISIPEYRLPRDVLTSEIEEIKQLGVRMKTRTRIESVDTLFEQGFDAVLLAVGTHRALRLGVKGEDNPGVIGGLSFLRDVNLGKRFKLEGKRVGVIGGGNVAIDAARTSLRLGAKQVQLICLESRREMPGHEWEIQQAVDEGVALHCSWGIKAFVSDGRKVTGIDCIRCTSVFDKEGRFNPSFDETVRTSFELGTVIVAIGQAPDLSFLEKRSKIRSTKEGRIKVDAVSLKTGMKGVFAAGDAVNGPTSVVEAIAAGRRAAIAIDKYLGGNGVISDKLVEVAEAGPWLGPGDGFADLRRIQMPCVHTKMPIQPGKPENFAEVELGFNEEMGVAEAKRCLQCQLRLQIPPVPSPPVK